MCVIKARHEVQGKDGEVNKAKGLLAAVALQTFKIDNTSKNKVVRGSFAGKSV